MSLKSDLQKLIEQEDFNECIKSYLKLLDVEPTEEQVKQLHSFSFEFESEYNDEGGYYLRAYHMDIFNEKGTNVDYLLEQLDIDKGDFRMHISFDFFRKKNDPKENYIFDSTFVLEDEVKKLMEKL